jgi:NAD(P)-dependent dehydrogenase (short-subunit alcohol dehydrogenase family)
MNCLTGKTVLVVGATGGLGAAIAQAFAAEGASLALAGRSRLPDVDLAGEAAVSPHYADLTDPVSLAALRDAVLAAHGRVDVVVNATGYDARKPLQDHTLDDFRRTLDVNLLGAMLLTQTFLSAMAEGVIVHLGGFADGRLAFRFYSADVAARAGVRAFTESVNRELALTRRPLEISFFSPSAADTEAERPFHPLWRQMGAKIVPPEKVAAELVEAVIRREKVHIMGGWTTRLFAALNAVSPRLADTLMMKSYGEMMSRFFGAGLSGEPS